MDSEDASRRNPCLVDCEHTSPSPGLNYCFYSSFIFLSNIILAFYYKYYLYSFLFIILLITSLFYHSYKNIYTNICDKIAILFIVLYGGFIFFSKMFDSIIESNSTTCNIISSGVQPSDAIRKIPKNIIFYILVIILFLSVIYLHLNQLRIPTNNDEIANKYHSLLHIISSIGHHIIIIL